MSAKRNNVPFSSHSVYMRLNYEGSGNMRDHEESHKTDERQGWGSREERSTHLCTALTLSGLKHLNPPGFSGLSLHWHYSFKQKSHKSHGHTCKLKYTGVHSHIYPKSRRWHLSTNCTGLLNSCQFVNGYWYFFYCSVSSMMMMVYWRSRFCLMLYIAHSHLHYNSKWISLSNTILETKYFYINSLTVLQICKFS